MSMRAALLGLGQIAWRYDGGKPGTAGKAFTHLAALRAEGIEVIAGADPDFRCRAEFSKTTGILAVDSTDALLALQPDIVTIASPNRLHSAHLRSCLDSGVSHILLEKPATLSVAETRELATLAKARRARVLIGFQRRYLPAYQGLKTSEYGLLEAVEITYSRGLETNGAHLIDLLLYLLNDQRPTLVAATQGHTPRRHTSEACPSALLTGPNGIPLSVTGLDVDHHSINFSAHFAQGRITVGHGGASLVHEQKMPNPLYPGFYRLGTVKPSASERELNTQMGEALPAMIRDLTAATETQPASNLDSAVLGQEVVAEILEAAISCG